MAVGDRLPIDEIHRYSLEEYHQLIESGGLDEDARVELLDGWMVDMSPKTPRHERAVRALVRWLRLIDSDLYEVGFGSPLTLAASEPEPDVAVFERGAPAPYHPASAVLVIEVAVSSLSRDLAVKSTLYASAGVSEYWVVDLDGRRVLVHRRPAGDRYAERFELGPGRQLVPEALDLPPLVIDELLRAADG